MYLVCTAFDQCYAVSSTHLTLMMHDVLTLHSLSNSMLASSGCMPNLQNVEVALKVLPKGVFASSDAEEEQHAVAEHICGVALSGIPPTPCD